MLTLESGIRSAENKAFLIRNMSEIAEIISEVEEVTLQVSAFGISPTDS